MILLPYRAIAYILRVFNVLHHRHLKLCISDISDIYHWSLLFIVEEPPQSGVVGRGRLTRCRGPGGRMRVIVLVLSLVVTPHAPMVLLLAVVLLLLLLLLLVLLLLLMLLLVAHLAAVAHPHPLGRGLATVVIVPAP